MYLSVEFADCTKIYYDFFLCVHRGRFISNIFDVVHACFSCEFVVLGVFFANNVYAVKKLHIAIMINIFENVYQNELQLTQYIRVFLIRHKLFINCWFPTSHTHFHLF